MKLQHIIIIFVIIIVPISLVLSEYINSHIRTINNQTLYNNILINATYDGIKAFQLNTANNMYSTIANSKIRDMEAAINVFFSSLGTNLGVSGYSKEELQSYIPAIMFNLYDGYYVYSNFFDTEYDDYGDGVKEGKYRYGLKPFAYYSCRYKNGKDDFVVNYTLDNAITIIGKIKGSYQVKTGHLLSLEDRPIIADEILTENLIILDETNEDGKKVDSFEYVVYNSQKIYKDNVEISDENEDDTGEYGRKRYFYYSTEYTKDYVTDIATIEYLNKHLKKIDEKYRLVSDNAKKYYSESLDKKSDTELGFTDWVINNLGNITQKDAVDINGQPITDFATNLGNTKIFDINNDNNPLKKASAFNEHRRNVIRRSIENSIMSALSTFSEHTVIGYDFFMPEIKEEEWDKIENNICMVSFFEGMPIGSKVYNNYCVASNNTNQETVGNDDIYIVDTNGEYHRPGCRRLLNNEVNIKGAYPASEFERKTVSLTGEDSNAHSQLGGTDDGKYAYYYPEAYSPCYDCIVSSAGVISTDDIIKGGEGIPSTLRQVYLTALARARYNLYLTNGYFGH